MRCKYCFYADVSDNRTVKSYGIMQTDTARVLIDRAFMQIKEEGALYFAFQGGEPTLAGLHFYIDFTHYVDEKLSENSRIKTEYSIQTNGYLIDDEFCNLFSKYNFLVGLSFDGTASIHDYLRTDSAYNGTAREVLKTAEKLKAHRVDFNIVSIITEQLAKHPGQMFKFYKKRA